MYLKPCALGQGPGEVFYHARMLRELKAMREAEIDTLAALYTLYKSQLLDC